MPDEIPAKHPEHKSEGWKQRIKMAVFNKSKPRIKASEMARQRSFTSLVLPTCEESKRSTTRCICQGRTHPKTARSGARCDDQRTAQCCRVKRFAAHTAPSSACYSRLDRCSKWDDVPHALMHAAQRSCRHSKAAPESVATRRSSLACLCSEGSLSKRGESARRQPS